MRYKVRTPKFFGGYKEEDFVCCNLCGQSMPIRLIGIGPMVRSTLDGWIKILMFPNTYSSETSREYHVCPRHTDVDIEDYARQALKRHPGNRAVVVGNVQRVEITASGRAVLLSPEPPPLRFG